MLVEVIHIDDGARISQGDIFEFKKFNNNEERFGIIITGDCDIAQKKVVNQLSFCYIMTLDEYFSSYYLQNEVNKAIDKASSKLRKAINKLITKNNQLEGLTEGGFVSLYKANTNEEIKRIVNGVSNDQLKWISMLRDLNISDSYTVENLKDLCSCLDEEIDKSFWCSQFSTFSNKVINQPGDRFYISHISHVSCVGFIVNLRRIAEIDPATISIYPRQEREAIAKRVGRLNSPYRERMNQKIGNMFSEIALPKAYEEERLAVLKTVFNKCWGNV